MPGWEKEWGRRYDPETKKATIEQRIKRLDQEGKIGRVVLDVGSGSSSVTHPLLFSHDDHKVILVDIAAPQFKQYGDELTVPADIQTLGDGSIATARTLLQTAEFLGVDPRSEPEQVDFIVLSEVLNYIDYRQVLANLVHHLKVGGRVLIENMPGRGIKDLMPESGVKDNQELLTTLANLNLVIEELVQGNQDIDASKVEPDSWLTILVRK